MKYLFNGPLPDILSLITTKKFCDYIKVNLDGPQPTGGFWAHTSRSITIISFCNTYIIAHLM